MFVSESVRSFPESARMHVSEWVSLVPLMNGPCPSGSMRYAGKREVHTTRGTSVFVAKCATGLAEENRST